jgi:hypothetical protein
MKISWNAILKLIKAEAIKQIPSEVPTDNSWLAAFLCIACSLWQSEQQEEKYLELRGNK